MQAVPRLLPKQSIFPNVRPAVPRKSDPIVRVAVDRTPSDATVGVHGRNVEPLLGGEGDGVHFEG